MSKTKISETGLLSLASLYDVLAGFYEEPGWWPAETAFEVMIGAVLTQNTAWTNVERAIDNLRAADRLEPDRLMALPEQDLAALIRPSGYYNIKADRLRHLCRFVLDAGGMDSLRSIATDELRPRLLAVKGIGPETADDILLYALERPVFVIDAYTRRLLGRLGYSCSDTPYDELRQTFERALPRDVVMFKGYHGLIVQHAKQHCAKRPRCDGCPLRPDCHYGRERIP